MPKKRVTGREKDIDAVAAPVRLRANSGSQLHLGYPGQYPREYAEEMTKSLFPKIRKNVLNPPRKEMAGVTSPSSS